MTEEQNKVPGVFFEKYPDSVLIQRFERLWHNINEKWGTEECQKILEDLVVMEDGRNREGFDLDVMSELLFLEELLVREHPEFAAPKLGDDVWKIDYSHE